ncbi:hypothetical protein IWW38_000640 [Coemansia aciculifera]|uniref:Uncharacterized protein n=1 Tax=Coemansia aciculifera TaxID=417176 RepID=A0ACC1M8H2_9FUNG|nr:hypothetical protein IWW38_000640 [Coemansia aciculifera]
MPSTRSTAAFDTRVVTAPTNSAIDFADDDISNDRFTAPPDNDEWLSASRHELRLNRCIAIPTETVYGLAANALDSSAVGMIYSAKGRPSDNPLIVHVSSVRMLRALYHLTEEDPAFDLDSDWMRQRLDKAQASSGGVEWPEIPSVYHDPIRRFWPGALTIVVPRPACIPPAVVGGPHATTVAVRLPSHPVARAIIAFAGLPLAAPSANASGRPSPTTAAHVIHDLSGRIPLVIDGGACAVGVESTVVDAFSDIAYVGGQLSPCVLRPGGVTVEALRELGDVWGRLRVYRRDFASAELESAPTTPGMKYRHYSPTAPVHLLSATSDESMQSAIERLSREVGRLGVIAVSPLSNFSSGDCALVVRSVADARDMAKRIFALLRELDETEHVDAILVQGLDDRDEGLAVMNRLEKAATHRIL